MPDRTVRGKDLGLAGVPVCSGVLFVVEAWREPVKD
jgi:hypothetical protein